MSKTIIKATDLVTKFGDLVVHNGLNFHIEEREIYGILGGSGSGKTVLLTELISLIRPTSGHIDFLGESLLTLDSKELKRIRMKYGVLFQFGALYSSLSVLENVTIGLSEYTKLPSKFVEELALFKLNMVGYPMDRVMLFPSEISGGMKKRVALARALALDPKILFLDEPTSGLDPASSRAFDELMLKLRELLGLSIVMVTHDKDTISTILDRFIIIKDCKVECEGAYKELLVSHPDLMKKFME